MTANTEALERTIWTIIMCYSISHNRHTLVEYGPALISCITSVLNQWPHCPSFWTPDAGSPHFSPNYGKHNHILAIFEQQLNSVLYWLSH